MRKKWGVILILTAIAFAGFFYIPGANELFSGKLGDLIPHGLETAGIIISLTAMLFAWISYPRVHNFRITWLGFLLALMAVLWFVLSLIEVSKEFAIPLYIVFSIIEIHFLLFLLLPNSARRKRTFTLTIVASLLQSALLYLLYFYSDIIPLIKETKWIKEPYILIALFSVSFILTLFLTIFTSRGSFYLGGMISGLQLYTLIFLIRGVIPFFPKFTYLEALNSYFFFLSLFLSLAILAHWFSRIEHQVNYDPLLKIYNRQYCLKILEEKSSLKTAPPTAVVMADIDHFKKVNDKYGHKAGDDVLYAVAQKIRSTVIPAGTVCRYGGEEFVIFFPKMGRKEAGKKMEKVRKQIKAMSVRSGSKRINVTISSGVSDRLDSSQTLERVLEIADKALYKAKEGGRDCIKTAAVPANHKKKKRKEGSGLLKKAQSH